MLAGPHQRGALSLSEYAPSLLPFLNFGVAPFLSQGPALHPSSLRHEPPSAPPTPIAASGGVSPASASPRTSTVSLSTTLPSGQQRSLPALRAPPRARRDG